VLRTVEILPCPAALETHSGRQVEIIEQPNASRSEAGGVGCDEGLAPVGYVEPFGRYGREDQGLASRHGLEHLNPRAAALPERGHDRSRRAVQRLEGWRVGHELYRGVSSERSNLVGRTAPGDDKPCISALLADPGQDLAYEKLQGVDIDLITKGADEQQRRIGSELVWVVGPRNRVRHDMDARGHRPHETPLAL
jgi:hypothetical protein